MIKRCDKRKERRVYVKKGLIILFCVMAVWGNLGFSLSLALAQALNITVRSGVHERYNRLVFDWPVSVTYSDHKNDNRVTVKFSKAAKLDFSPAFEVKLPFIKDVSQQSDASSTVVSFLIPDDAQVQTFKTGNKIVLDVLKNTKAPVSFSAPTARKQVSDSGDGLQDKMLKSNLEKARDKAGYTSEKAAAEMPKISPEDAIKTSEVSVSTVSINGDNQPSAKENTPLTDSNIAGKEAQSLPIKNDGLNSAVNAENLDSLPVETEKRLSPTEIGKTVIRVRPAEKTRMAVFKRAGFLWIVFDKPLSDVPPEVEGHLAKKMLPVMRYNAMGGTAYRLSMPAGKGIEIVPHRDNLTWEITLQSIDIPMTKVEPEIDYVTKRDHPAITFRTIENPGKVLIEDPEIGDQLFVVTLFGDTMNFDEERRFPEFMTVPAELGIVVKPLNENVIMDNTNDGVRVMNKSEMILSPESDLRSRASKDSLPRNRRIFDLVGWQSGSVENFIRNRRLMESRIIKLEGVAKASGFVDLAKLFVANGLGSEAMGALDVAHDMLPDLDKSPDYHAIRGAARAMFFHEEEAMEDLNFGPLKDQPEAHLWMGYAASRMNKYQDAVEHFKKAGDIVSTYPERLKPRMLIAEITSYLEIGDVAKAKEKLEILNRLSGLYLSEKAAYNYLSGRLLAMTEDYAGAQKMLEAAMSLKDSYYGVQARFDLINALKADGKIDAGEAIKRFEGIRFSWRGDELEIKNLHRLGQLYLENKKYAEGLSILRQSAVLSKSEDNKSVIAKDMAASFSSLFVDGEADKISPVRALSVFNEFRELLPVGQEGTVAMKRLSERMISVDLLEQSAALMEKLIQYHVKGQEAAEVGTRLAVVRLLDHKPEDALKALDQTENPEMDKWGNLKNERIVIRARALSDKGDITGALSLLDTMKDNYTGMGLTVDINWRAGKWEEASSALEKLIDYELAHPEKENLKAIQQQQERVTAFVLKRGIALALAGKQGELKKLSEDYGELMKDSDKAAAFAVVIRPPQPTTLADLQTLKSRVNEVEIFQKYLTDYNKEQEKIISALVTPKVETPKEEAARKPKDEAIPVDEEQKETPPNDEHKEDKKDETVKPNQTVIPQPTAQPSAPPPG